MDKDEGSRTERAKEKVREVAEDISEHEKLRTPIGVLRVIWHELTAGVGAWGSIRPLIAASLALVPFLFLGQHFNRHHRKAFDWTLLQVPLLLSVLLWPVLWVWSVIDAYQVAMFNVAEAENKRRDHLAAL